MRSTTLIPFIGGLAAAIPAPTISGYSIVWSEDFAGSAGSSPDTSVWNIMDAIDTNAEVQTYTTSNTNVQLSGGSTIQFVPRKSNSGIWTSGRIETVGSWTPTIGKVMIIQARIALGTNPADTKQGLWPAFWTLGQAVREGTEWPLCGELDIMEQLNGVMVGYGTAHCGTEEGGPCNETTGKQGSVTVPDDGFHTWSLRIDRTSTAWTLQTISWLLDDAVFYTITGAEINDQATWATLAHSPLYILLNVAVGGDWPGDPNDATVGGYGAMMEVQYVSVYST